jgi:hypothetical protein
MLNTYFVGSAGHEAGAQTGLEPVRETLRSAFGSADETGGIMLERERLIEIVAAVTAVLLMLGAMIFVGTEYGGVDGTLSPEGGEMLIGVIIGFIFLLTAVGIGLAFLLNDPEDGLEDDDAETESAV